MMGVGAGSRLEHDQYFYPGDHHKQLDEREPAHDMVKLVIVKRLDVGGRHGLAPFALSIECHTQTGMLCPGEQLAH
jgi:hypothetical protein